MGSIYIVFGTNLSYRRGLKGYSLRKLGEKCGINHAALSRMENGLMNVTLETLSKLATALDTTPDKLLTP